MADYKAISQHLIHSDIRVTDGIYAPLLGNVVQQRAANLAGQVNHPLPMDGDWMSFLGHLLKADNPAAFRILADCLAQSRYVAFVVSIRGASCRPGWRGDGLAGCRSPRSGRSVEPYPMSHGPTAPRV